MRIIQFLTQNKVLQHLLFWAFSFYVLLRLFAYEIPPQKVDYIYTFLFHLSLWVGTYINLSFLIPYLLGKGKYLFYAFSFAMNTLLIIGINELTFETLSDWFFPGYYFISYYNFYDLLQFALAYLGLTSLLKLSRSWFEVNKKNKLIKELETQKLNAELAALKHQLNPHLLFNSLNAIYNMILDNHPKAGDALLFLAENMRYVLYQTNVPTVSMKQEVNFINNYIQLHQLRIPEGQCNISFNYSEAVSELPIAPLLFLPFIENAFKHGLDLSSINCFIQIKLSHYEEELIFRIKNSKSKKTNKTLPHQSGGIGLINVKERLERLYPGRYQLSLIEEENNYEIILSLKP